MILPVSPNPTTAAINKILPPTADYPHGTVRVKLKTAQELTTDVQTSLAVFDLTAADLECALGLAATITTRDCSPEAKPHLNFLQAIAAGLPDYLAKLGQELVVDFPAFREFIVQEHKACLTDWIELYYTCALTEQGIILVDTPGSNSTNARHTGVAFDYIKNADAILFVTYFNNAFCKADAQFLSQLGKVKDAFELDKMFFLVNAADLAQSPSELTGVVDHVLQNLKLYGIHKPRIYPVSSQLALLAKLNSHQLLQPQVEQLYRQRLQLDPSAPLPGEKEVLETTGFALFEHGFHSFFTFDLVEIAVQSARRELDLTLAKVTGLLEATLVNDLEKMHVLEQNRAKQAQVLSSIGQISSKVELRTLLQEIDELFFYVNQRLGHRLPDMFNNIFFVLAKPKEDQPKNAVDRCLEEYLREVEAELAQEIRATSLRLERFCGKLTAQLHSKYSQSVLECAIQGQLLPYQNFPSVGQPHIPALPRENTEKFAALYRNPKDWVSGGGRTRFLEGLQKAIQPVIGSYLTECAAAFKATWEQLFTQEAERLRTDAACEINSFYAALQAALNSEIDTRSLEAICLKLQKLTNGQDYSEQLTEQ